MPEINLKFSFVVKSFQEFINIYFIASYSNKQDKNNHYLIKFIE